jgi:hypothetical protein
MALLLEWSSHREVPGPRGPAQIKNQHRDAWPGSWTDHFLCVLCKPPGGDGEERSPQNHLLVDMVDQIRRAILLNGKQLGFPMVDKTMWTTCPITRLTFNFSLCSRSPGLTGNPKHACKRLPQVLCSRYSFCPRCSPRY